MKKPKPRTVIKTKTPGYFFGSGKAADSRSKRLGIERTSAKLPTSLSDLKMMKVKLR